MLTDSPGVAKVSAVWLFGWFTSGRWASALDSVNTSGITIEKNIALRRFLQIVAISRRKESRSRDLGLLSSNDFKGY